MEKTKYLVQSEAIPRIWGWDKIESSGSFWLPCRNPPDFLSISQLFYRLLGYKRDVTPSGHLTLWRQAYLSPLSSKQVFPQHSYDQCSRDSNLQGSNNSWEEKERNTVLVYCVPFTSKGRTSLEAIFHLFERGFRTAINMCSLFSSQSSCLNLTALDGSLWRQVFWPWDSAGLLLGELLGTESSL